MISLSSIGAATFAMPMRSMSSGVLLSTVDNGDGSGTVTMTGTESGASNRLYRANWTGQPLQLDWIDSGTRTGDGSITVDAVGYWLWRLESFGSTVKTAHCYGPIIDPTKSPLERVGESVQLRIASLNLPGLGPNRIAVRWAEKLVTTQDEPPMIVIGFFAGESFVGGTTQQDDIGIPFVVGMYDKPNEQPIPSRRVLGWRWAILKALRNQRLAGVPETNFVRPEPGMVFDKTAFDNGRLHSTLPFRVITRTTRG